MKQFLKKYMPSAESIKQHKILKRLGPMIHQPGLWSLNRHSAALGLAIGFFFSWIPIPFQMVPSALIAVLLGANLPLALAGVWVSNPITMPPMFYFAYRLGLKILDRAPLKFSFELSFDWLYSSFFTLLPPMLLGCLILAVIQSIASYFIVRCLWKHYVVKKWKKRSQRSV